MPLTTHNLHAQQHSDLNYASLLDYCTALPQLWVVRGRGFAAFLTGYPQVV